jgi:hypothetical protein
MYFSWIQRAYQGGQRVLVALAVNSKLLADITMGNGDGPDDDLASGDMQISEIKAFVLRHSDFMQVVTNSAELLNAVSSPNNKLAVVLGVELDNIGDLAGNQPASAINVAVQHLYDEGVRYIFPIHLVDNPIGGSAVYQDLFNVADAYEEGANGYALACAAPADNILYAYTPPPSVFMDAAFVKLGSIPTVPPAHAACYVPCTGLAGQSANCQVGNVNSLGLTVAGQQAIQYMMGLHMLIDIDHMSQNSANMTLAAAQRNQPYPYPLNSGHNGIRGASLPGASAGTPSERSLTAAQYGLIGKLHGMAGVGSAKLTADQWLSLNTQILRAMGPGAVAAFGTDINGMEFAMPPRTGSAVQYGTVAFPLPMSKEGNQSWDYNKVGVAHYGMLPDYLQDVQSLPGGSAVVSNMLRGAQYFYETWRLAEGNPPAPSPPPRPPLPIPLASGECPGIQIQNQWANFNVSGTPAGAPKNAPPCVCPPTTTFNAWGQCACNLKSAQWSAQAGACALPGTLVPSGGNNGGGGGGGGAACPSLCHYGCTSSGQCASPARSTGR